MLTLDELHDDTSIDTVIVAFTDMQGRLMGKRLHAEFFVEEMDAGHVVEGCNYLLALEMEMDPVPGYEIASWEQGYGDFDIVPDFATLRRIPWLEGTVLVLGDVMTAELYAGITPPRWATIGRCPTSWRSPRSCRCGSRSATA